MTTGRKSLNPSSRIYHDHWYLLSDNIWDIVGKQVEIYQKDGGNIKVLIFFLISLSFTLYHIKYTPCTVCVSRSLKSRKRHRFKIRLKFPTTDTF